MNRKVLILEDRFALRHTMVNLGDRAYHVGLHELIRDNLDLEIVSGRVKAMPWLTSDWVRGVRSIGDAERLFERRLTQTLESARRVGESQKRLLDYLNDNVVTRSVAFRRFDAAVRRRLSRGVLETILPYVFRRHYAAELVASIERADLVIFNGGAFIADHLDRYLPMVLFELYLAKRMGKEVMVVNQTVAVRKETNRALVGLVYPMLDKHLVREPRTRQELLDLRVAPERIVQSADAAFGLYPALQSRQPAHDRPSTRRGVVGLCVRGDRPVPTAFWADIARMLENEFRRDVVFFFTSEFQDLAAFKRIAAVNPARTLDRFLDYPELIEVIAGFDLVVTDRYHAVVFAMLAGTPVVPVDSNTFKTRGLMDMVDYPLDVLANDGDLERARCNIATVLARQPDFASSIRAAAVKLSTLAAASMGAIQSSKTHRASSEA